MREAARSQSAARAPGLLDPLAWIGLRWALAGRLLAMTAAAAQSVPLSLPVLVLALGDLLGGPRGITLAGGGIVTLCGLMVLTMRSMRKVVTA